MPDETSNSPLRIDIVSDVMCPWCAVGYGQLAQALKASGTEHDIHWHPFELNPDMPAEGQDVREHLAQKYGTTPAQSEQTRTRLRQVAAEVGFDFTYSDTMRMHNTFSAHQLIHWAGTQGQEHALKMALLVAHFTDERDLSDDAVLADVAHEIGLDRAEALAVLDDQRYAKEVRDAQHFWHSQGISGVPAIIFDRQHLVTGAQGVDNYTSILSQLSQMKG